MDNSFLYTKTLLLVDDEPDLLKMLSDILKDAGFQKILTATTGKEAVAEAKKGKPDLIILFTNTVSHKMAKCAVAEAKKSNAQIVRCHTSSGSALSEILENVCLA